MSNYRKGPTENITFRVKKATKAKVMKHYKGSINKLGNQWFEELANTLPDHDTKETTIQGAKADS